MSRRILHLLPTAFLFAARLLAAIDVDAFAMPTCMHWRGHYDLQLAGNGGIATSTCPRPTRSNMNLVSYPRYPCHGHTPPGTFNAGIVGLYSSFPDDGENDISLLVQASIDQEITPQTSQSHRRKLGRAKLLRVGALATATLLSFTTRGTLQFVSVSALAASTALSLSRKFLSRSRDEETLSPKVEEEKSIDTQTGNAVKTSRSRYEASIKWVDESLRNAEEAEDVRARIKEAELTAKENERRARAQKWAADTLRSTEQAKREAEEASMREAEARRKAKIWAESIARQWD